MPYAKEPFRWGTFIVTASSIGLAVYLYEIHGVNVYFWLAWLFGLEPGWWGAVAGLLASIALFAGFILLIRSLEKMKCYRVRFRNRTKLGWIRERLVLGGIYYSGFAGLCAVIWLMHLLIS
ncbi:MAG: hypothetical protein ACX94C_07750 [Phycisphaerales bacterium]